MPLTTITIKLTMKLILFLVICLFSVPVYAGEPEDILGLWYLPEDDNKPLPVARIFESVGKFYAVGFAFNSLEKNITKDINNRDPKLKDRLLIDVLIIKDLVFDDDEWVDGEIYNPENGKTYHLSGSLSDDEKEIKWRASVDKLGVFGITIIWSKVDNPAKYKSLELSSSTLDDLIKFSK